jgi:hypothetical protein
MESLKQPHSMSYLRRLCANCSPVKASIVRGSVDDLSLAVESQNVVRYAAGSPGIHLAVRSTNLRHLVLVAKQLLATLATAIVELTMRKHPEKCTER